MTTRHDDHVRIEMSGELDNTTAAGVVDEFARLGGDGPQRFVVDAQGLTFVGFEGIAIVERLLADHPESTITIVGASPVYLEMLAIADLGPRVQVGGG